MIKLKLALTVLTLVGAVWLALGAETRAQVTGRIVEVVELPVPATLADNTANPSTLSAIASYLMCYDGATWDRCTTATDVTEDVAETQSGSGPMVMSVRRDATASSASVTGDNATFNTDELGRLHSVNSGVCGDQDRLTSVAIDTAASGNTQLIALASSQIIYVCGYSIVSSAPMSVQLIYGTGTACATGETDLHGPMFFAANGGITQSNAGAIQFKTAASNALCIELSAASQVSGHVTYAQTATP